MVTASGSRCGFLAAGLMVCTAAGAAPDAAAIMKKAQSLMEAPKTYQARWLMSISMGQMGTVSMNMDVKIVPGQGKIHMKLNAAGQGSGQIAMTAPMASMELVDDGKTAIVYKPLTGNWQRSPHQSKKMTPSAMTFGTVKDSTFRMVKEDRIEGIPVYVIQAVPRASASPPVKADILFFVNKNTSRLKQMTVNASQMGQGGKAIPMAIQMLVKNETLNAPIPDSVFKFTPPPGAREIKGGPGGLGGGMFPGFGGLSGGGGRRK